MGQHNFKKPFEFLWHDQSQEHKFEAFYTNLMQRNHFKKQKYGTDSA